MKTRHRNPNCVTKCIWEVLSYFFLNYVRLCYCNYKIIAVESLCPKRLRNKKTYLTIFGFKLSCNSTMIKIVQKNVCAKYKYK